MDEIQNIEAEIEKFLNALTLKAIEELPDKALKFNHVKAVIGNVIKKEDLLIYIPLCQEEGVGWEQSLTVCAKHFVTLKWVQILAAVNNLA